MATTDHKASTVEELTSFFLDMLVPGLIKNRSIPNLTVEDFVITETTYDGYPAIQVIDPLGYRIWMHNDKGTIMGIVALRYNGATTTEKDRNTKKIMETFKVLD